MSRMGKSDEDWNGLKLRFLKTVQPNRFSKFISAVCNFKNNAQETFVCLEPPTMSFTCNFFAYFKFHSYWRGVIGKIKQNGLDRRDTTPFNETRKYKTALPARKVTGTFEEQAPGTKNAFPSLVKDCIFLPTPTILRTSGFHCKLCIFWFLLSTMSKSWYIVVCHSIYLVACLCVCHSLFLTLTAVVSITDKPFSLWLDKRWIPKVRQCRHCVGAGRAHEHGILDLCQSSTCDGCWKQA